MTSELDVSLLSDGSNGSQVTESIPDYNSDGQTGYATLDPELRAINGFRIFVCTIGVLGNLVVILMILLFTEFKKGVTHWYILQLAIADSAFLLTLPFQVVEDVNNEWIFPDGMCKAKEAVLFINYYSSIAFLTVMAMDRYIAVCHAFSDRLQKLRTTKAAYIITAIIWTVAILICIPIMMYSTKRGQAPYCKCELQFPEPIPPDTKQYAQEICLMEGFDPNDDQGKDFTYDDCVDQIIESLKSPVCAPPEEPFSGDFSGEVEESDDSLQPWCHYINYNQGFLGFLYFNFIVMFMVPFVIIAACYILIIIHLYKTRFRGSNSQGSKKTKDDRDTDRVVIMCAVLVIVFAVCWLPYHSVHLAKMTGISGTSDYCSKLLYAASLMAYLNSAINPFIYFIVARFKAQFRRLKKSKPYSMILSFFGKATKADSSDERTPKHTHGKDKNEINERVQEDGV